MALRILFLTDDREDYLSDSLLHGLRQLNNLELTDYPRKDCLYESKNFSQRKHLRGGGFTLYGLLKEPDQNIFRGQIWRRLNEGDFDAVIISNIWRQWGIILQWQSLLAKQTLILLDGDDDQRHYPSSRSRYKQFGVGTGLTKLLKLPRTHIFKREWTNKTHFNRTLIQVHSIGFAIPQEKIISKPFAKKHDFPSHIVDQEVAKQVGAQTNYVFEEEEKYRQNLAEARFGITCQRGGWDCLRHYEIAASGTIPCFRNLKEKPSQCAPHDLHDGKNCIAYSNAEELFARIKKITVADEKRMQKKALDWANKNNTVNRALQVINQSNLHVNR